MPEFRIDFNQPIAKSVQERVSKLTNNCIKLMQLYGLSLKYQVGNEYPYLAVDRTMIVPTRRYRKSRR